MINYDTRTYSYKEIKGATNNFSSENKLDYGELGLLYKAILSADEIVAVKRATRESQQSHTDFQNGTYLSRLRQESMLKPIMLQLEMLLFLSSYSCQILCEQGVNLLVSSTKSVLKDNGRNFLHTNFFFPD